MSPILDKSASLFFLHFASRHALCICMMQAPLSLSSSSTAATSSDNHNVNGQRKPFRRNNSTSSSTSNPPNTDQNHTQRSGSATTQSRHSHRHRSNGSSYPPPGDGLHHGNRRNFDQSSFRNSNGRGDMHLQPPQSGFGMMRPQMLMGSPSNAQYMSAPQIGSYGGPVIYPGMLLLIPCHLSLSLIYIFHF